MESILSILLIIGLVAFIGWSVYDLVKSIQERKKKNAIERENNLEEKK